MTKIFMGDRAYSHHECGTDMQHDHVEMVTWLTCQKKRNQKLIRMTSPVERWEQMWLYEIYELNLVQSSKNRQAQVGY